MRAFSVTQRGGPSGPERGAAVLEAALVLPVCFLLFFGMLAIGGAMRTYSGASNAVRAAARMASLAGADPMSDRSTLERLAVESGGIRPDTFQYVVIWHATGPGTQVPAACRPVVTSVPNVASLGVSDGGTDAVGACNVYVRPSAPGGAFDIVQGRAAFPADHYFGCQGASDPLKAQKLDCNWPGKNRRTTTTPRGSVGAVVPPDFIGVYARAEHPFAAGIFGWSLTMSDTSINLVEPRGYSAS
jgi:hypothetical protein